MKIDRHSLRDLADRVKPAPRLHPQDVVCGGLVESPRPAVSPRPRWPCLFACDQRFALSSAGCSGQQPSTESATALEPVASSPAHSTAIPHAVSRSADDPQKICGHGAIRSACGGAASPSAGDFWSTVPSFHAKVRETVWTNGREVVGVGTYEQAGGGSGRFNLQVTMHDGDGKHRLQQISDGRLAWTRTEIAGKVSLRRVDVGRLDEWVGKSKE